MKKPTEIPELLETLIAALPLINYLFHDLRLELSCIFGALHKYSEDSLLIILTLYLIGGMLINLNNNKKYITEL